MSGEAVDVLSVDEAAVRARAVLPAAVWDFLEGGSEDEATVARNRAAYAERRLVPRVLTGRIPDAGVTLLGSRLRSPFLVAPTAAHVLFHPDAEEATARGAHAAGALHVVATYASRPLEAVAAAAPGPKWLQLYPFRPLELTAALAARADRAGYEAVCLTVDVPVVSKRERDRRRGFSLEGVGTANLPTAAREGAGGRGGYLDQDACLAADLRWEEVEALCRASPRPVVLKGILHPEDARRAVEVGAAAVVVSNHGGRQLDGAVTALDVLPAIGAAVARRVPVLADGGVRRGRDAFVLLAAGADAVLVGRGVLYGLAIGGARGVAHVLDLLREELETAMALCGCGGLADIGPDHVLPPPDDREARGGAAAGRS